MKRLKTAGKRLPGEMLGGAVPRCQGFVARWEPHLTFVLAAVVHAVRFVVVPWPHQ